MARMTLRAIHADERRRWPLNERVVDENLGSYRHGTQPRKQRRCGPVLTESLQVRSAHLDDAHLTQEFEDAAWLYAWSYADLRRPVRESLAAHAID